MPRTSNKRAEILEFVTEFLKEHGFSPSIREICQAVELRSTATVYYHLNALRQEGALDMERDKKRAISLPQSAQKRIPILSEIRDGKPILATEHIEGYLPAENVMNGRFALHLKDDSMVGSGLLPDDLVLVRPQQEALDGQIVVAMVDGSAVVRRYLRTESGQHLISANGTQAPIDAPNFRIIGRVVYAIRRYE